MPFRSAIHDATSALEFLFHRINYERTTNIPYIGGEFKLDRMRELMRLLGDPQTKLPVVHVAGTKGKGSTASMIAAGLIAAGYNTGLYTSPHLERLEERYVFNHGEITATEFVELVQVVEQVVNELDHSRADESLRAPTFFEITTALAFLHFIRRKADIAVLEVGLGGRLDSTNVCLPVVCAITSISFDHTKQLGHTLAAIAREKAGIMKPGVPVVSGVLPTEPREVIQQVATETQAPLFQRDKNFFLELLSSPANSFAGPRFNYRELGANHTVADIEISLRGEHQVANAGTAIAAFHRLNDLGWNIPEAAIREGLANVRCPARIELVRATPPVLLDTAHNVASIEALCQELERNFAQLPRVLVFATSRDKDAPGILKRLLPLFSKVVLTKYVNNPRSRSVADLLQIAQTSGVSPDAQLHTAENPLAAWQRAQQLAGDHHLICITGSFFLAAEIRPFLAVSGGSV